MSAFDPCEQRSMALESSKSNSWLFCMQSWANNEFLFPLKITLLCSLVLDLRALDVWPISDIRLWFYKSLIGLYQEPIPALSLLNLSLGFFKMEPTVITGLLATLILNWFKVLAIFSVSLLSFHFASSWETSANREKDCSLLCREGFLLLSVCVEKGGESQSRSQSFVPLDQRSENESSESIHFRHAP